MTPAAIAAPRGRPAGALRTELVELLNDRELTMRELATLMDEPLRVINRALQRALAAREVETVRYETRPPARRPVAIFRKRRAANLDAHELLRLAIVGRQ